MYRSYDSKHSCYPDSWVPVSSYCLAHHITYLLTPVSRASELRAKVTVAMVVGILRCYYPVDSHISLLLSLLCKLAK